MSNCFRIFFRTRDNDLNKILKIKYFNILKKNIEFIKSLNYFKNKILKNIFFKLKINLKNINRFELIENQNINFLKYIRMFHLKLKISKYFIFWSKYLLYCNIKLICFSLKEFDNSINFIFNESLENNRGISIFFKLFNLKKENNSLKKSIETINDSNLCIICCENQRDILFKPCNHFCLCRICNNKLIEFNKNNNEQKDKLSKCPICRKNVNNILDVSSRIIS